ncbi:unnamed protein product [Hydatigera taeniaeformis]|uniref:Midasin n=1 Tax=Hydatigena taeniaeformis TaxID=6205 RepID=A0A0R3WPE7_HYDTA|nr:unnamed protein product [Hydatigera taeniaeformis]
MPLNSENNQGGFKRAVRNSGVAFLRWGKVSAFLVNTCRKRRRTSTIGQNEAKRERNMTLNLSNVQDAPSLESGVSNLRSPISSSSNVVAASSLNESVPASAGYTPLPCFMDSVASVALAVDRNDVPLVCGPVGCGKTAIIDYLASLRSVSIFRMQISEQTDTKALLGLYCCSSTPGVFVWRPGPLVHCMTSGKWLVLEDVDKGSADFPILRRIKDTASQMLYPNTGEPVFRHPGFRLLLTCRTGSPSTGISDHISGSEIYIVEFRSPDLLPLARRLLSELPLLKSIAAPTNCNQRPVCSRDFFKFLSRALKSSGHADTPLHIYLDALDCFVCSQSVAASSDDVAIHLGGIFNFSREQALKIWKSRKPKLRLSRDLTQVEAGRAVIPIKKSVYWELQPSRQVFADTRLACTLVERLAVAIQHAEPVLLVGETGTGKTSAIQRLALMAGRRLRVLNLSQQSDIVDLLGGFKPVDSRALMYPVKERFESLFMKTFRLESNRRFLEHIQTCAASGRWRDLLTLLRHPAASAIRKLTLWRELEALERRGASSSSMAFAFIEGALVRALEDGDWVLLDEINLAPVELLDCLSGLLDSAQNSVTLVDRGFRIWGIVITKDKIVSIKSCIKKALVLGKPSCWQ